MVTGGIRLKIKSVGLYHCTKRGMFSILRNKCHECNGEGIDRNIAGHCGVGREAAGQRHPI
jgi:hypothetical protein